MRNTTNGLGDSSGHPVNTSVFHPALNGQPFFDVHQSIVAKHTSGLYMCSQARPDWKNAGSPLLYGSAPVTVTASALGRLRSAQGVKSIAYLPLITEKDPDSVIFTPIALWRVGWPALCHRKRLYRKLCSS